MLRPVSVTLVLLSGLGLGILFYSGLWLTVRALPNARRPVALTLASFWGRTALVLAGFVVVTAHRWQNAVICLLGFVLARILLPRWLPGGKPAEGP